jgi:hypothetical protein
MLGNKERESARRLLEKIAGAVNLIGVCREA